MIEQMGRMFIASIRPQIRGKLDIRLLEIAFVRGFLRRTRGTRSKRSDATVPTVRDVVVGEIRLHVAWLVHDI